MAVFMFNLKLTCFGPQVNRQRCRDNKGILETPSLFQGSRQFFTEWPRHLGRPLTRTQQHHHGCNDPTCDHESEADTERTSALTQFSKNLRSEISADAGGTVDEPDCCGRG